MSYVGPAVQLLAEHDVVFPSEHDLFRILRVALEAYCALVAASTVPLTAERTPDLLTDLILICGQAGPQREVPTSIQ